MLVPHERSKSRSLRSDRPVTLQQIRRDCFFNVFQTPLEEGRFRELLLLLLLLLLLFWFRARMSRRSYFANWLATISYINSVGLVLMPCIKSEFLPLLLLGEGGEGKGGDLGREKPLDFDFPISLFCRR